MRCAPDLLEAQGRGAELSDHRGQVLAASDACALRVMYLQRQSPTFGILRLQQRTNAVSCAVHVAVARQDHPTLGQRCGSVRAGCINIQVPHRGPIAVADVVAEVNADTILAHEGRPNLRAPDTYVADRATACAAPYLLEIGVRDQLHSHMPDDVLGYIYRAILRFNRLRARVELRNRSRYDLLLLRCCRLGRH
jgi:hypothetical protein